MSRTASAVGHVRIEFELDCDGPCLFEMSAVRRDAKLWYIGSQFSYFKKATAVYTVFSILGIL